MPTDRRLPAGWLPNMDNVLVAPPLGGQARLDYIQTLWQAEVDGVVTEEKRGRLLQFNASTVYWDVLVDAEYVGRLHSFCTTGIEPPDDVFDEEEPPLPPPSCASQ